MQLSDYMRDNLIFLDLEAEDKKTALIKTVDLMKGSDALTNPEKFLQSVLERERLGSTAIGKGVALPHARTPHVNQIIIAMSRLKKGLDFGAEDGQPVKLIFLLGTPLKSVSEYLNVLARLSRTIKDDKFRKKLLKAETAVQVRSLFEEIEE